VVTIAERSRALRRGDVGHHHDLELLEADPSVAVAVDAAYHAPALRDGGGLPDPAQHPRELGGGDGAVAVGVEDAERAAEVLLDGVGGRGHEGRELGEADVPVAIGVRLLHHARELVVGGGVAHGREERRELGPGDAAVAVGVELAEHALELVGGGRWGRVTGGGGGARRRGGGGAGAGTAAAAGEEGAHLAHGGSGGV
jgi:hypothetical protein